MKSFSNKEEEFLYIYNKYNSLESNQFKSELATNNLEHPYIKKLPKLIDINSINDIFNFDKQTKSYTIPLESFEKFSDTKEIFEFLNFDYSIIKKCIIDIYSSLYSLKLIHLYLDLNNEKDFNILLHSYPKIKIKFSIKTNDKKQISASFNIYFIDLEFPINFHFKHNEHDNTYSTSGSFYLGEQNIYDFNKLILKVIYNFYIHKNNIQIKPDKIYGKSREEIEQIFKITEIINY